MNKKGFTLIELLAVIIILALLALLTSTAITKIVKDSKEELSETQIASIEAAAKLWGADNLDKLPDTGECGYLTLKDLKGSGLIDSNIIDPKNNENISDDLLIKLTTTTSSYGDPITNYEVDPDDVEGCVHSAQICSLQEGSSKVVGSKYSCILDQNRTFYVLENNPSSDNISLIMDRNIGSPVAWITEEDYISAGGSQTDWNNYEDMNIYGPITANTYLASQTLNWRVMVSLPTKSQIEGAYTGSMPIWLYDYISSTNHIVPNVYGYWISSIYEDYSGNAWYVGNGGIELGGLYDIDITSDDYYGVRPVITISKDLLD